MTTEIICRWNGKAFEPLDDVQFEIAQVAARGGREIKVSISHPRNPRQHRLLFALLKIVADNHEKYDTVDKVLLALKFATGQAECNVVNDTVVWSPKSISFAAMGQDEFNIFFDLAIGAVTGWLLKGVTREQVLDELTMMTGIDCRAKEAA